MVALLNSLFFVFKISFLPKYRVIYYDYIVKWCSGNWCVSLDISQMLALSNVERSEYHTQIKSQTNAPAQHIHPPSRLRDRDANNRITEEDQSRGNEMLSPPFAHFYKDHITNEIVYTKYEQPSVLTKIY